jgi:hypothetical protein
MRGSYGSVAALGAACLLLACDAGTARAPAPPPEEDLASVVPDLVDAVQAKQPIFIMDHVATSFREERGLDYFDVRAIVEGFALRDEEVGARLESVAITPAEGESQRVAARVAFALGQRLAADGPLPPGAVIYALDLLFAKEDGRWRAQSGRYKRE